MASRTGTLKSVVLVRGEDDQASAGTVVRTYEVQVQNDTANTVIGGTDTLDIATLGASIKSSVSGRGTFTVVAVSGSKPALVASTEYGMTAAMSSTTLQITPKSASDWSTNATLPANSSVTLRPYSVLVTVLVS